MEFAEAAVGARLLARRYVGRPSEHQTDYTHLHSQWTRGKKKVAGHLGDASNMYYNEKVSLPTHTLPLVLSHVKSTATKASCNTQLKRWVEKGKEDEVANDPGSGPPPTTATGLPSGPTQRFVCTASCYSYKPGAPYSNR